MDFEEFFSAPEFREGLGKLMASGQLKLPPPVFTDMEGEFIDLDLEAKTLTVRFPVLERYQNPMGYMQGGMIAAAVDNTIGPLSFMVANPNVTKTMEMSYLRPISDSVETITVTAALESENGRDLTFTAEVKRSDGAVLALARSHNVLLKRKF